MPVGVLVHEESSQNDIESLLVETQFKTKSSTVTGAATNKLYIKPRVKGNGKCFLALK